MKKTCFTLFVLCPLLLFTACARMPVAPRVPALQGPGDKLFASAEKHFAVGALPEALQAFKRYVQHYPQGPRAAAALFRIGTIYNNQGNPVQARRYFEQLMRLYPQSRLLPAAMLGTLRADFIEQDFPRVIRETPAVLAKLPSDHLRFKAQQMLAGAYLQTGDLVHAVPVLGHVHALAPADQKPAVADKIKNAVRRLNAAEVLSLLKSQPEGAVHSELLYRLGKLYLEQERYEDALGVFEHFLKTYPRHADAPQVRRLVEELQGKSVYNHFAVGCLLPLSGPFGVIGHKALDGVELAFYQTVGGDRRTPFKLVIKDSGGEPERAVEAVKDLAAERVAAIIGPIVSARSAAVRAQSEQIPMITLSQKAGVPAIGDYIFRNFITPEMQVKSLVDYAVGELGVHDFAVFYPREKYGLTFMQAFWDEVTARGGRVTGAESYRPGQTDFADAIKKLTGMYYPVPEALQPESLRQTMDAPSGNEKKQPTIDFKALFIPDSPEVAGLIIPQLAFYDIKDIYLFGTNLWHSQKLIRMAQPYVRGAIMPAGFFGRSRAPQVRAFVSAFHAAFGRNPGFIEAVAYDTAMILLRTIGATGLPFRSTLREKLRKLSPYDGVTGLTIFGPNGDAQKKLYLLQVRGSGFAEVSYAGARGENNGSAAP